MRERGWAQRGRAPSLRPQPAPLRKGSAPGDPRPTRVLGLRRGKGHGVKYPLAPRKAGKEGKARDLANLSL